MYLPPQSPNMETPSPGSAPVDEGSQIQMAYQQFLGRQASPDEIQGWLSGAYGYGRSGNLTPIFEAIRQSAEAQQRPPIMGPGSRRGRGGFNPESPPLMPLGPSNRGMGLPPQRGSASPLGAQNMDRMRKAILGVPEY